MQIRGESDFARKPVLENCALFTCVQCGYCGYLILGGSARELLDEEERHAIECKATHGLIGAGRLGEQWVPLGDNTIATLDVASNV